MDILWIIFQIYVKLEVIFNEIFYEIQTHLGPRTDDYLLAVSLWKIS